MPCGSTYVRFDFQQKNIQDFGFGIQMFASGLGFSDSGFKFGCGFGFSDSGFNLLAPFFGFSIQDSSFWVWLLVFPFRIQVFLSSFGFSDSGFKFLDPVSGFSM